jgi:hypothetical protein
MLFEIYKTERIPTGKKGKEMEKFIETAAFDHPSSFISLVTMCAWCSRLKLSGESARTMKSWVKPEGITIDPDDSAFRISHGICPHCKSNVN